MSIGSSVSGISFSGIGSGIDTESIVKQLMQLEQIPIRRMQTQQLKLQSRLDIYGQLQSQLTKFNSAAAALNVTSAFSPIKASVTDSTVATVSVGSNAVSGTYNLEVQQLATFNKVVSAAQTGSDTALGKTGEFMVNGKSVTISATDTLSTIASKINGLKSGVTASIIGGSGSAYLSLTSSDSGASNAIAASDVTGGVLNSLGIVGTTKSYRETVAGGFRSYGFSSATDKLSDLTGSTLSGTFTINGQAINVDFSTDSIQSIANSINTQAGSTGVTAKVVEVTKGTTKVQKLEVTGTISGQPSDPNGILGAIGVLQSNYSNEVVSAEDASYTIDGLARTSSTNTVSDVVAGLTITLLKDSTKGPAVTTINLNRDTDQIKGSFKAYMDAFNGFADFVKSNTSFDSKTFASGPLFGDQVTTQAMSAIQNALFQSVNTTGPFKNLADLGFGLDSDGKLTLDDSKLSAALDKDPEAVKAIMTSVGSSSSPDISYVSSTNRTQDPGSAGFSINISQVATKAMTLGSIAQSMANRGGETLTFSGKAFPTDVDMVIAAGTTATQLAAQINADSRLKDSVVASVDTNGKLKVESKRYGSLPDFQVKSNLDADVDTSGIGKTGMTYVKGVDVAGKINGEDAVGTGQYLVGKDSNATSAGLQIQYTGTATGDVGIVNYSRGLAAKMLGALNLVSDTSNGVLTATNKSVQSQIDDLTDKISSYQDRLQLREQSIRAKFLAMEQAIAQLQQQQQRLATLK